LIFSHILFFSLFAALKKTAMPQATINNHIS